MACADGTTAEFCNDYRRKQTLYFGWIMLALWLGTIVYLTRDLWIEEADDISVCCRRLFCWHRKRALVKQSDQRDIAVTVV
uniref:Inner membrane protein n=1 Tax=Syphacia muris TaxID=451379 RepID=A0A0N5AG30_9BILA